jgi:hypothetical protein
VLHESAEGSDLLVAYLRGVSGLAQGLWLDEAGRGW